MAQIARFLVAPPGDAELGDRMADRARAVDQDIARLTRTRDSLRHASTCTHTPLIECPEFKARIRDANAAG